MHNGSPSRLVPVTGAVILIGVIACADSPASPRVEGRRAPRDTTILEGDSTVCRSGFTIQGNRIICNGDQ